MVAVVVELDEDVIERLRRLADQKGLTVQEVARDIVARGAPLTPEERVALAARIRAMQTKPATLLSEEIFRKGRDMGWRNFR